MKLEFDDKSYIEILHSKKPNKIQIIIAAKNHNEGKTIVNSVEINQDQLYDLVRNFLPSVNTNSDVQEKENES